jgi:two-component system sensor histidine kinase UhpB
MDPQVAHPPTAPVAGRHPGEREPQWQTTHLRASVVDLTLVLCTTAAVFVAGTQLELHETFARWVSSYERWQLDELPATLLTLAAGLFWFALRRWREGQREIERRLVVERNVRQLLARNRELSQWLIAAQEAERQTLARELHDELGQRCNAIQVEAACTLRLLGQDGQALGGALAGTRRIVAATEELYRLVHDMLRRLRPALLDSLGLVAAIQELCERWESRSGVACRFVPCDVPEPLTESVNIAIFRAVQEALSNVLRHSGATRVDIGLCRQPGGSAAGRLVLMIVDNGRGFDATAWREGLGLVGMRERVAALGGDLAIRSAPGRGACLEIVVPLR